MLLIGGSEVAPASIPPTRRVCPVGLKAKQMSNANDDKSPLIGLLTCIVCKVTMKIANSVPDAEGSDLVLYRCELCHRTELVRLFRRSRDAAA